MAAHPAKTTKDMSAQIRQVHAKPCARRESACIPLVQRRRTASHHAVEAAAQDEREHKAADTGAGKAMATRGVSCEAVGRHRE